jgi:hypothetical protein
MAAAAEKNLRTLLADIFSRPRKFKRMLFSVLYMVDTPTKFRDLCLLLKLGLS